MTKFHINKHGVPAPCHAKKGKCPLGGDSGTENHFDSEEQAQAAADAMNEQKYGVLDKVYRDDDVSPEAQKKLNAVYAVLEKDFNEKFDDFEAPENSDTDLYSQVDLYVKALDRKHNGEDIDLESYAYDLSNQWSKDLDGEEFYSDDDEMEQKNMAEDAGAEFLNRVEAIDEAYKITMKTDWDNTELSKDEALEYTLDYAAQVASD